MQSNPTKKEKLSNASPLKQEIYYALEDPRHGGPASRTFGTLILVIIAASALPTGYNSTDYNSLVRQGLIAFNIASTFVFAFEYGLRLWIADIKYPNLSPARARIRYAGSALGIIDLLSFLPMAAHLIWTFSGPFADAIRIIRLVRLVKISRYMRGLRTISIVFRKRKQEIIAAFMVIGLICVASSILVYEAEHPVQPDKFDSMFSGLYWALTTMTSTGYGDLAPITPFGRFIGAITMILSIGVVAIPAGIFSAGFVAEFRNSDNSITSELDEIDELEIDDGN